MTEKTPSGLRIIGALKLISATLLAAVGFGIFHYLNSDIGEALQHLVVKLHLGPGHHLIEEGIAQASGISKNQLRALDIGTFFYALLYITEGMGLILGRRWAEYLTIVATASLLPLECYEIWHKMTETKIIVLLVNLIIVGYLVWQLRAEHRRARALGASADAPPETASPHNG